MTITEEDIDLPIKHESKPYLMIPFPDGTTNGDMIKTLFEGKILMTTKRTVGYKIHSLKDGYMQWFDKDWWNAPYKKEGDEETEQGLAYADQEAMMPAT